ncbi:hypothetical protein AX17_000045 [Amanita inopinata Kibby_2008]|nr:hypothetical protein AX17_000045 [Amanita inopinata Kibby_2008]
MPPNEQARRRLAPKSCLERLSLLRPKPRTASSLNKSHHVGSSAFNKVETMDASPIILDDSSVNVNDDDYHDRFAWAILYENQRGLTIFSVPHYSRLSLLPTDPAPFTLPNPSRTRSKQQFMNLDDYQLPDGTWQWVSKSWMIDMRSDAGEVQHDGFEYNWLFRTHHWRAEVGSCSASGLVRRRRWIRLMMRPAKQLGHDCEEYAVSQRTPKKTVDYNDSGLSPHSSRLDLTADDVWLGQDPEEDWSRCHALLKTLGNDGQKLDIWVAWLGPQADKGKTRERATGLSSAETTFTVTHLPAKEHIIPVLRQHVWALLQLLIFPDSRARLLELFAQRGLLSGLIDELGIEWALRAVDFWSYSEELLSKTPVE